MDANDCYEKLLKWDEDWKDALKDQTKWFGYLGAAMWIVGFLAGFGFGFGICHILVKGW